MKKIKILILILPLVACYDTRDRLDEFDTDLLPQIEFDPAPFVNANGSDTMTIKMVFPIASDFDKIKGTFTTSVGTFIENGEKTFTTSRRTVEDIDGLKFILTARLLSTTTAGSFEVLFEAPEITWFREQNILFQRAFPTGISTSASKFAVARGFTDEIQLSASLKSGNGKASKGTAVEFIVADSLSSNSSTRFRALTTSNASGISSVFFTPGTFGGYSGPVTFEAVTMDEDGNELRATGTFEVVDPS